MNACTHACITVGPNGPKLRSWEHIWAYLCKEFSYSHFWPDDSEWGYKKLNKPNWPWLTFDDLEMALENIFFSVCPSFNHIFSPKLRENEKSALIRFWARHYRIHLQKNRYKEYKNDLFFVKVEINIFIFSSTARHVRPTKITIT